MAQRTRRASRLTVILVGILAVAGLAFWLHQQNGREQELLLSLQNELAHLEEQNEALSQGAEEAITEEDLLLHLSEKTEEEKAACGRMIADLERAIRAGKSKKKIAYLTFDDGPYQLTPRILDILEEKDVRATFFLRNRPEYVETIRREIAAGHSIANHSYSHKIKSIYQSTATFVSEIERQQQWLTDTFGVTPSIYRFPGGSPTAKGLRAEIAKTLAAEGLGYIDWNAYTGDGLPGVLTQSMAYQNVMKTVEGKPIVVVLMHDYCEATADALPDIIDSLREKGYILLPLFGDSVMIETQ